MLHKYTKDQEKFLSDNTFGRSRKEITEIFNRNFLLNLGVNQITSYIKRHKFNTGRSGRFEKGQVPFNKGKKKYWIRGEDTQIKKGSIPHN
jgi:hypothetical protein